MSEDDPIVYVLDDDYRVREALTSFLSSVGLRVEVFASAAEYLKFQKPDSPACLILDLELPGMSGLDLQREIAGGDAPAMAFVTGHGDVPSSIRAIKAGAIEFLLKPLDAQELLRAIDAAIAQDREARLKRAEMAKCGRYASSDAWRASALAVRGSRSPQQSRPRPNSATVRSPFRFIVDRSCAKWRPHPWQIWSKWQEHWGFPNLMKTIGVYIKT